jgi:hypothetical protein
MIGIVMRFLMMFYQVQRSQNWKQHDGENIRSYYFLFMYTNNPIKSIGVGWKFFFSFSLLQKRKIYIFMDWWLDMIW